MKITNISNILQSELQETLMSEITFICHKNIEYKGSYDPFFILLFLLFQGRVGVAYCSSLSFVLSYSLVTTIIRHWPSYETLSGQ
jgi:hypothetical protein